MFPLLKKSSFFAQTFISRILSISNPQWGIAPLVASATTKAFFPISFTNTEYVIVAVGHIDDNATAYIKGALYNHKETNTCLMRASETNGPAAEYVALGH